MRASDMTKKKLQQYDKWGLSARQISERTGISVGTVYQLKSKHGLTKGTQKKGDQNDHHQKRT